MHTINFPGPAIRMTAVFAIPLVDVVSAIDRQSAKTKMDLDVKIYGAHTVVVGDPYYVMMLIGELVDYGFIELVSVTREFV